MSTNKTLQIQETFLAGDEWLFYKIYTGYNSSDVILSQAVKPILKKLLREKVIDKWFFIRYADPKHHIRLRFHIPEERHIHKVMEAINPKLKRFMESDMIWNVQIDTYKREVERYGATSMELSEELFFHDSEMAVAFIDMIAGAEGEELRWLFCMKSIDVLLDDFQYSSDEKTKLADKLRIAYGKEFDFDTTAKKQINSKYSLKKNDISGFMDHFEINGETFEELQQLIVSKSKKSKRAVKAILELKNTGKFNVEMDNFMTSHIHMTANRLFKSKARLNETVVYEFLYKYYKSVEARKKQINH